MSCLSFAPEGVVGGALFSCCWHCGDFDNGVQPQPRCNPRAGTGSGSGRTFESSHIERWGRDSLKRSSSPSGSSDCGPVGTPAVGRAMATTVLSGTAAVPTRLAWLLRPVCSQTAIRSADEGPVASASFSDWRRCEREAFGLAYWEAARRGAEVVRRSAF